MILTLNNKLDHVCDKFSWRLVLKDSSSNRHIRACIYGDLVYRFKRIVGKPNFSDQFKKIIKHYKRVGYNMDIM